MDAWEYYTTTLTNAGTKILPVVVFILGGYFVFVKLPFLFFMKSMEREKKRLQEEKKEGEKVYTLDDYRSFQKTMKELKGSSKEERKEEKKKTESKKEGPKHERKPHRESHRRGTPTPEEIFMLRAGEVLDANELKKRYFELLKQNHPDRVSSMGDEFKRLAEKNTKEINRAYDQLKKKAS
jgi:hypothetical protein